LVVGMAVGVGLFSIALSIFAVFSLTAIIVKNGKIFAIDDFEHIFRVTAEGEVDVQVITNLLSIYVKKFQLLGFEYLSQSNQTIITYELSSLSEENFNKLQENIHKNYGKKLNISFVAGNSSITY
jgi:hypothetical protein